MWAILTRFRAAAGRAYRAWAFRLRPRCPNCRQRTLEARPPAGAFDWDPSHAPPDYYRCESCGSRYKRFPGGPMLRASGEEDDQFFTPERE